MKPSIMLEAVNLHKQLKAGSETLDILNDLSFEVARGEWIALTGPSGSGKSTLLGILAGIDTPSAGSLWLDGLDISTTTEHKLARIRNCKIGIVFQSFNLIPTMTAQENVEMPLYIHPRASQASNLARQMLELVGLGDRMNHLPHQLSGGQQQRVAIARALVTQPDLLLADEPTGNLDTSTGDQILNLFDNLRQQLNLTMIMVTHDAHVASRADRILHLVDGRFVSPIALDQS